VGVTLGLSFNGRMYCVRKVTDTERLTGMYECNRTLQKDGSELFNEYLKEGNTSRTYTTLAVNFKIHTIINLGNIRQRNPSKL
jgi:hypothetical protein